MIDALVAAAGPLPTEYANRKQTLLCNDCEVRLPCGLHHDNMPELLRLRQLSPMVAPHVRDRNVGQAQ